MAPKQKHHVRHLPGGAPSPFSGGGFSFDPKSITAYTPAKKRWKQRPGDIFGSEEVGEARSRFHLSRLRLMYIGLRYDRSFQRQMLAWFLFFFTPGVIVALLVAFGWL